MNLHRVTFETGADNEPMRRWFEGVGVVEEGVLKEAWSDGNGGWVDAVTYRILAREWGVVKEGLEKRVRARRVVQGV